MDVHGSISYASQDPWLFPSTIRQNILFGEEYNPKRYAEVIRVCALVYDFSLFDDGDLTVVADNGINLSKGQQARVNLARTVYRHADIYLLDDPLTALDSSVQDFIFKECLLKFLKNSICIFVSQNPNHLKKCNNIIVLNYGEMVSDKITENEKYNFDEKNMNEKNAECQEYIEEAEKKLELDKNKFDINIYKEIKEEGSVHFSVYTKYWQYSGGFIILTVIMIIYVLSMLADTMADKMFARW